MGFIRVAARSRGHAMRKLPPGVPSTSPWMVLKDYCDNEALRSRGQDLASTSNLLGYLQQTIRIKWSVGDVSLGYF